MSNSLFRANIYVAGGNCAVSSDFSWIVFAPERKIDRVKWQVRNKPFAGVITVVVKIEGKTIVSDKVDAV